MRFRDMHMQGTARIVEQLCDADQFLAAGMQRMDFGLRKYVSTSALAIRNIAAGPDRYCLTLDNLTPAFAVFVKILLFTEEDSSSLARCALSLTMIST